MSSTIFRVVVGRKDATARIEDELGPVEPAIA